MNNKYQELFQSLSYQNQFRPSINLGYTSIDEYASELLSGIFERDIGAESVRSDFYDWSIKIKNGSITETELELLYEIINANEYDRKSQSFYDDENDGCITELCQIVSHKLFSKILPFEVEISFADDEDNIWFLGGMIDKNVLNPIQRLEKNLPNGMVLTAEQNNDPNYPV